jgi:uncharacterized membrane protein
MNKAKLSKLWDSLRSSYWFVPTVMAIATIALASITLALDRTSRVEVGNLTWIYTGGPDGARALLSAVAGSMVSVAATAFSITIVALQLASSNFGPRLLRNFMQDTGNQFVLGTFISTFIYSLLILRTIRGENYNFFVPELSITIGIILAIFSIGVLIYFIHHASTIIQVSHVIESVSTDLDHAINRLFPEKLGQGKPELTTQAGDVPDSFDLEACPVSATDEGYLQAIDNGKVMGIAQRHDLLLRIKSRPGKFVVKDSDLVLVSPKERIDPKLADEIVNTFVLGRERTEQQDIEFPINQLVEIALRALSPSMNDPFTAIRCIDRLSAALSRLAQRQFPSPYRYDDEQKLRVIVDPVTFEMLIDDAFNQIRQSSKTDVAVTIRLLEALALIASYTHDADYHAVLRRHADMIKRGSKQLSEPWDCHDIEERYQMILESLRQS